MVVFHALMVVILEVFLHRIERKATRETLKLNVASSTNKRYIDDSQGRFQTEKESVSFLKILIIQNSVIRHTTEKRLVLMNETVEFLEITVTNDFKRQFGLV